MKHLIIIIFLLIKTPIAWCQQKQDPIKTSQTITSQIQPQVNISFPDTLQLKNIPDKLENNTYIEKSMPWVIALLIGVLSVFVNLWVAHQKKNYYN